MKTRRTDDSRSERAIMEWLFELLRDNVWSQLEKVDTREEQLAGIDLRLASHIIDVKVQAGQGWVGSPATTQCLELSSISMRTKERVAGWFKNNELATTHYIIGLIHEVNEITNPEGYVTDPASEIKRMELIFIKKDVLKKYIHRYMNPEQLEALENELLRTGKRKHVINPFLKMVCSHQLAEKPVNLCLDLGIYRELAENIFLIEDGKIRAVSKYAVA